jgi:hypothetical protein
MTNPKQFIRRAVTRKRSGCVGVTCRAPLARCGNNPGVRHPVGTVSVEGMNTVAPGSDNECLRFLIETYQAVAGETLKPAQKLPKQIFGSSQFPIVTEAADVRLSPFHFHPMLKPTFRPVLRMLRVPF